MPKKSKPRKPVSSNYEDAPRGRTKRDKIIRAVTMLLVFGLVATFLIGALVQQKELQAQAQPKAKLPAP